jgi:hypothetical protein
MLPNTVPPIRECLHEVGNLSCRLQRFQLVAAQDCPSNQKVFTIRWAIFLKTQIAAPVGCFKSLFRESGSVCHEVENLLSRLLRFIGCCLALFSQSVSVCHKEGTVFVISVIAVLIGCCLTLSHLSESVHHLVGHHLGTQGTLPYSSSHWLLPITVPPISKRLPRGRLFFVSVTLVLTCWCLTLSH